MLQRCTSAWDEMTVYWNNQPSVDTTNQAILPKSTSPTQNYKVDVIKMTRSMALSPQTNFGFRLKLATEQEFNCLLFASSDHRDKDLRPMLEVYYTNPKDVKSIANTSFNFSVFPNPANDKINIEVINQKSASYSITLVALTDKKVLTKEVKLTHGKSSVELNVSKTIAPGIYILKLESGTESVVNKIEIQ